MSRLHFLLSLCLVLIPISTLEAQTMRPAFAAHNILPHDPARNRCLQTPVELDSCNRTGAATMQTAFQILVASSPELPWLRDKGAVIFGTAAKMESSKSTHVEYDGALLQSREICWWKVRVWDERGTPTAWSEPASWEMGLLKPADWQAKWIDAPTFSPPEPLHGALSILHASYDAIDGTLRRRRGCHPARRKIAQE